MNEANLTRLGPLTLPAAQDAHQTTFTAIDGAGRLIVQCQEATELQIQLNGKDISISDAPGQDSIEIDITLSRHNTLQVSTSSELQMRVTQRTQADLGIVCQGYFGLNTSDMAKQRALYETMGFIGEIYPAGPETSTSFARSLGFADDYLIYVSLHSLQDPPTMPFVDTVQFRGDSYRDEPPYAQLNHLGMAYATYSTTDLQGDYEYLQSKGVSFLSPPATAPNGEQFVFMQDQDGAFIKFIATDQQRADSNQGSNTSKPNLVRLVNTNMNVSDLERSREFYRLLGFTESTPSSQSGDGDFATAHGFSEPIAFDGVDVSLGEGTDGATLQLRQWQTPYDDSPPYPPPVNHLGIDRINFYVKDLTATIQTMNDLGFTQLGPIGGAPEIGIVFFFDPDGIKVQFAGPQTG